MFGGGAGFSSLLEKVPLGPSVCLILDLPCSSRKLFRVAVRCFLLRLSLFSPFLWLKERQKFIVLLLGACCVERAVLPLLPRRMRLLSLQSGRFPPLLHRRQNLRGQPFWLTLGKGLPWRTLSMCMRLWRVAERSYPGTRYSTPGIPPHGQKEVLVTPRSSWTPSSVFATCCSKSTAPRGCSGTSSLRVVASAI